MNNTTVDLCNSCADQEAELLFSNYDRMFRQKDFFNIVRCPKCGLIYISSPPRDLYNYYDKNKYSVFNSSKNIKDLKKLVVFINCIYYHLLFTTSSNLKKTILKKFNVIFPFFRITCVVEDGNFLDVGCGNGYYLLVMKYLGMNTYGVEPGEFDLDQNVKYNLNIFNGNLIEAHFSENFFDVITLNHVLEHVNNPLEYMSELYRILKPGGYLVIGVPLSDSLAFSVFGKYWAQLDTPRHLFCFSKTNLIDYAKKSNFKIIDFRYNSAPSYQIICSIIYFLEDVFKITIDKSIIYNPVLNLLLLPLTDLLNFLHMGDQGELVLSK